MLRHLGSAAMNVLLGIFNQSWKHGRVPDIWKEASIIPIHKKGEDKKDAKSYRPISFLSCVSKLLKRIVNQRLQWYLETYGKLSDTQTGFRKNKNTEDQLTYFAQKIENGFQEGKKTVAVFFDMAKAFDTVWKDGLLLKLVKCGIAGNMYKWIKSFLENRTARVKMDGVYSRKVNLKEGWGSARLCRSLQHFSSSSTKLCQQQVQMSRTLCMQMIWSSCEYVTTANLQIQETVNRVSKWAMDWGLKINKS